MPLKIKIIPNALQRSVEYPQYYPIRLTSRKKLLLFYNSFEDPSNLYLAFIVMKLKHINYPYPVPYTGKRVNPSPLKYLTN